MTDRVNEVVLHLRACADRLTDIYTGAEDATVDFPARTRGERQPVRLSGQVRVADVAELVHYVADMLEE